MSELNFMHENIFGIYNYCDRWCEECQYTNRCLLFKQEAEREIKYLLKDENITDDEHFSKVLADELQDAEKIFNQNSDMENSYDYSEDDDELEFGGEDDDEFDNLFDGNGTNQNDKRRELNPLIHLAEEMLKELEAYCELAKKRFPQEIEINDVANPIIKKLQILEWYLPQAAVKIRMCFWEKLQLEKAKEKNLREINEEMLNVSSRIVYLGIEKSITALKEILTLGNEFTEETKLFLSTVKMVRKMFIEEFPNGQNYKRPYFD
ncbi:MAG: hypothetical protein HXY50_06365 [Ignavibacteriaceae bacterium]|nr:hypothetical protein [Ignavibacteriaceae bacterium]